MENNSKKNVDIVLDWGVYTNRNTKAKAVMSPLGTVNSPGGRKVGVWAITDPALNNYAKDNYSRGVGKGFLVGVLAGGVMAVGAWICAKLSDEEDKEGK